MSIDTSLSPLRDERFGLVQAQHLLNRAGFGGTPSQVKALATMGVQQAVAMLVDYQSIDMSEVTTLQADADILRPPSAEEKLMYVKARRDNDEKAQEQIRAERIRRENEDRGQMRSLEHGWLQRMVETPRPLEEKLTLLWHGHFATNYRTVRDSFLMYQQNQFFRDNAAGNFAQLARGIIRDPAMLRFLDNNTNRKGRPNENLARELMELFTLGEGQYSESDIKEGARALTGYSYEDNDFVFNQRQHDAGAKKILGQSGAFAGDEFVDLLLKHPACARFIAFKLYKHFVMDVTDPRSLPASAQQVVKELSDDLRRNRYELRPVLKKLFASRHFYDAGNVGSMIKSPVQLLVGTVRMLDTPTRTMGVLTQAMQLMGQELFNPPSVAGWDGGRSWINSSTLFVRQNLCIYLITGRMPTDSKTKKADQRYDPTKLLEEVKDKEIATVVDLFLSTLLPGVVTELHRTELMKWWQTRGGGVDRAGLTEMLVLITALPEYQLC